MSDYHAVAAEQGELLKAYAQEAWESGDEEGWMLLIRLQLIQEKHTRAGIRRLLRQLGLLDSKR